MIATLAYADMLTSLRFERSTDGELSIPIASAYWSHNASPNLVRCGSGKRVRSLNANRRDAAPLRSALRWFTAFFDELALPGFTTLMNSEKRDDKAWDGIEPGRSGECVEDQTDEGRDAEQDADSGFGRIGQNTAANFKVLRSFTSSA